MQIPDPAGPEGLGWLSERRVQNLHLTLLINPELKETQKPASKPKG